MWSNADSTKDGKASAFDQATLYSFLTGKDEKKKVYTHILGVRVVGRNSSHPVLLRECGGELLTTQAPVGTANQSVLPVDSSKAVAFALNRCNPNNSNVLKESYSMQNQTTSAYCFLRPSLKVSSTSMRRFLRSFRARSNSAIESAR
jgi:hypothetical protein